MTSTDILRTLGPLLDERRNRLKILDEYYAGRQPLTYLAPEAAEALGNRLQRVSVNIPRVVVGSLVERLRVTGLHRDGQPDPTLWKVWTSNDLDQLAPTAHREALTLGAAYVIVWAGPRGPRITAESAHQVLVDRDPASREVISAVKLWHDAPDRTGVPGPSHAVVYEPDRLTVYRCDSAGAPADSGAWTVERALPNPLGVVPVVPLVNAERLLDTHGRSEFADVIPLVDMINKTLTDMSVTSEFYARPRRWATGIEIPVDAAGQPIDPFASEVNRTWISEASESRFGQFQATDLGGYENAVRVITQQIVAVTGLPEHTLGIGSDNPTSADAIRASEAALTARAEAKQALFGRSWEAVARLAVAVRDGTDPAQVDVSVKWNDPATRSAAQDADAAVKLVVAGVLPPDEALRRLGYSDEEIGNIREMRRTAALDASAADVTKLLGTGP